MWNPKRILAIVLLIATAVVLVVFLYALSDKMNQVPNGFNRKLNTSLTVYQYSIQTDQDVYRIAGVTPYHLYLSTLLPGIVVDINLSARTIARDTLTGAHFPGYHVPFQMTIDSPAITIGIGNFKKIYSGNIPSKRIEDSVGTPRVFLRSCPMPGRIWALCSFDTGKTPHLIFEKFNAARSLVEERNPIFPNKEADMITADGLLQYDTSTRTLFYCLFYESHFLAMDSNTRLKADIHTVDTFHANTVKGGFTGSSRKNTGHYTNISPRRSISANFSVFDGLVYIQSRLKADNDSAAAFLNNTVIDVYDSRKQSYLYSCYLPHHSKELILDFKVVKGRLLVLYPSHLDMYSLKN
jgi:hypothetical protein